MCVLSVFIVGPNLFDGMNFFIGSVVLPLAAPMLPPLRMSAVSDAEAMLPDNAAPALSETGFVVIRFFGFKDAFKDLGPVSTVDNGRMTAVEKAMRFVEHVSA